MMDAQETDAPKVYVVKVSDPAEQGHANQVVATFFDKELADDAADQWTYESREEFKDRFAQFAIGYAASFYVEEVEVITSADAVPARRDIYPA
jgi:hypothetical protein